MLDDLQFALGGMGDRLRGGLGVLASDPSRLGTVVIFAAVVFAVIIGSSYTIDLSAAAVGSGAAFVCTGVTSPYILPVLTNPLNTSAFFVSTQCTVNNGNFLILGLYFLEVLAIILLGVYLCVVILNLSG